MTTRSRVLIAAGALLLPLLFLPLVARPTLGIAVSAGAVGLYLASRSVAYPLALSAAFSVLIGVLGRNPFPNGAIAKVTFVWVCAAMLIAVLREDDVLPLRVLASAPVVLSVATAGWMLVRLGASSVPAYGSFKLQLFVAENLTFMVGGIVIARRRKDFNLLLVLMLAMSAAAAVVLARGLAGGNAQAVVGGRFALSSDYSPILFGRDAARGITIAVFLLLVSGRAALRLLSLAVLPLLAVSFTAAGSRGPALGLIVGLLTLLALTLREPATRARVLLAAAGGLAGAYLVALLVPGEDVSRSLSFLVGNTSDASANGRNALWHLAANAFLAHPVAGLGTGGYAAIDPNNLYPHDLVLETAAELGLVGLLLVIGTIVAGGVQATAVWRRSASIDKRDAALVLSLLAAAIVNALFSGDIATNHAVWLSIGLGLGIRLRTGALPPVSVGFAWVRGRRQKSLISQVRSVGTAPPGPDRRGDSGRILSPEPGAAVSGLVRVEVEPAWTARPVDRVRLEWRVREACTIVAEVDERTFEVVLPDGSAAIVRSQRLAEVLASALGARPTPSRRRPWARPRTYVLEWDTAALPRGEGSLRAVTRDIEGTETATPAVELEVVPGEVLAGQPSARSGEEPARREPPAPPRLELRVAGPILRGVVELAVSTENVRGAVALEAARPGERKWRQVGDGVSLDTSTLPEGRQLLRATGDGAESSPIEVVIDNEPPAVRVVAPRAGAEIASSLALRVDAHDRGSGVHSILFQRSADGALWRPVAGEVWDTARDEDGEYLVRAVAVDHAHNVAVSEPVAVTVRNAVHVPPAPDVPSAAPPDRRPTLFELEELLDAQAGLDPYREEELRAILYYLRDFAELDGTLPPEFDPLLEQEFGELARTR